MKYKSVILYAAAALLMAGCASMGSPDGGPYDEEAPIFVSSTPVAYATNVTGKKIVLEFDENIKLENPFEKVVVSPPQIEMPEIKYSGKRITIELFDSLKPNTTYSVDFNDAIVDNNEGNPLENFAFVFSTGGSVDTLAVSGTVLNAQDLEPIKGIMVGVHKAGNDSAFYNVPFERVSRTDSRGRFTIKGLAPGRYRVYALKDANQNYRFDQKSEKIAFLDAVVEPFATPAVRPDTIWRDSVTIDTIKMVAYTRFQPDDLVLRAFDEEFYSQYLMKSQRKEHNSFTLFFADSNVELPVIEGLNFDAADAFVVEPSEKKDTILYWIKDTIVYYKDTLELSVTYKVLDSLGIMVPRTDTITLSPRRTRAKVLADEQRALADAEKAFMRNAKRRSDYDENNPPVYVPPTKELRIKSQNSQSMDVNVPYRIRFDEPLLSIDTAMIHVEKAINDSTYTSIPFRFRSNGKVYREYIVYAEWRPEEKYRVTVDSAAFKGLYGGVSKSYQEIVTFRSLDSYAVLRLDIPGAGSNAIVELLKADGSPVASEKTVNNRCTFYFVNPGKYYLRMLKDTNGNGVWDTGDYGKGRQPEVVYYYPHALELRALFEYDQDDWNINTPLDKQKPIEITKQKPDKERKKRNRNANRKFK
ncbi:MAG: Ig-like domain-containing protein [Bacteroidaceae bacterium]|nr:Ig-like domain-containing protein [Bacteroidaceae bacterium]